MLHFEQAATAEAEAWRNLLPPEPWLETVKKHPEIFGEYARFRLETGITNAPSVVSRARKPHQQTRPVPILGIPERITYRALCHEILDGISPSDRSQEAYKSFISGPLRSAFDGKRTMQLESARIQYVIESDIAAFYEYVDHSRLLSEVQLRTFKVDLPRLLIGLLEEIQGRPFGLPQLLDPSDELSEIYARIIERELRRRGIEVWRYNDDFRIAAATYEEAQAHVEALAHEASAVGLILNERKTRITKFSTYFWKNWIESPSEGDIEFKPELVKISNDYGDLEDDELTAVGHKTFEKLDLEPGERGYLDLSNLTPDENHELSRAIGILTKQSDSFGLAHIARLFEYAPFLSHRLGMYMIALHEAGTDIGPTWDKLITRTDFFNAWQRLWLVHVARVCKLLSARVRRGWVKRQRTDVDPLLKAEATLTLAPYKLVNFDEIDRAIRTEPEALIAWYALAAKSIPNVNQQRIAALKEGNKLVELLLYRTPKK
ncbi:reverse transcriptase domain-containing protein [Lentzea sp. NEAU-D7]|uniref:reverse transcriptase domain-containing protein n=1 Tax=Lentzea sp. NEAU-D7 TaxID=2994667 RepID=UPI00224B7393|nr:reverse transcriptase domain-containing protein [Lentzea sp. NEAU-D7]MCX2954470.1 reverse transcriptase domain-containing protein [Lentzea sp. NEAU-D7]